MNWFTIIFESLFGFVRRNPVTCVILIALAVACPPLFGFVAGAFIVLVLLGALSLLLLLWRLRKVRRSMERQFGENAGRGGAGEKEEGDVSVYRTSAAPAKKINDDVGEYVDFEEEPNKKE